ncbi:MAG: S1C family serine protease [Hyphomicrobiaceae bacterium]
MDLRPEDFSYPLDAALDAVVGLKAEIAEDAYTARTLGTERQGHGVLIPGPLVLTIGYLVTEAEQIWLTLADERVVPGHLLGFDQETGVGLVQPLARISQTPLEIGTAAGLKVGHRVVVAGSGGREGATAARIIARHGFAGYWEYALDDALFTAPSHPHWGGTGLIAPDGRLAGIGSLQLQAQRSDGTSEDVNMVVPIDVARPVLADLQTIGRPNRPARPWLGVLSSEMGGRVVIVSVAERSPAAAAGLKPGDIVLDAAGRKVEELKEFYRAYWALGTAGVDVPLTVYRDGKSRTFTVRSTDRRKLLKGPVLH